MSALALRFIACIAMLLDHIGYSWGIIEIRMIGRIAFPIFVYLIYNGYKHTSSKTKYALRLFLFAVLSQVPFSLFCHRGIWGTNGNVFFTLLAALLCLWSVDVMRSRRVLKWFCLIPSAAVCLLYHWNYIQSDYNAAGILMILVFYFCDHKGVGWKVLTCIGFVCVMYYEFCLSLAKQTVLSLLGMPAVFPVLSDWQTLWIYSAFALPLIFAYNGKKGKLPKRISPRVTQYAFYWFYPVHLLLLWIIRSL